MNIENKQIENMLMELVETIATLAKHPVVFGDIKLYRRELHIIALIGAAEGITSTELANFFGITRGVTHKVLIQLEKQGFIYKTKHPENEKSIAVYLTEAGKNIFSLHDQYHKTLSQDFQQFLSSKNSAIRLEFIDFLQHLLVMAKKHL